MAIIGTIVLTAVVVKGGFSASAAGGDREDPLVTLSYLTEVVTPELLDQVDKQVEANEQALLDKLNDAIDDYTRQMEQALSQSGGVSGSFTAVSVAAGETLQPAAGSELLLRSGSAVISAGSSPALLDATSGAALETGGSLAANHLYVAALDRTGITASSAAVFLVRGAYTVA